MWGRLAASNFIYKGVRRGPWERNYYGHYGHVSVGDKTPTDMCPQVINLQTPTDMCLEVAKIPTYTYGHLRTHYGHVSVVNTT